MYILFRLNRAINLNKAASFRWGNLARSGAHLGSGKYFACQIGTMADPDLLPNLGVIGKCGINTEEAIVTYFYPPGNNQMGYQEAVAADLKRRSRRRSCTGFEFPVI